MCANIVERTHIVGSGKGEDGWFRVTEVAVSYDHPFHAPEDHAVNIDFLDPAAGIAARVPVELSLESARRLAETLMAAVERAEAFEGGSHVLR